MNARTCSRATFDQSHPRGSSSATVSFGSSMMVAQAEWNGDVSKVWSASRAEQLGWPHQRATAVCRANNSKPQISSLKGSMAVVDGLVYSRSRYFPSAAFVPVRCLTCRAHGSYSSQRTDTVIHDFEPELIVGIFGHELESRSVRLSNGMIQVRELEARRILIRSQVARGSPAILKQLAMLCRL
jgi:hypothetical protein